MTINILLLTKPEIIEEIDAEAIITMMRDDLVARFPAIVGVIDLESEPARKLIEVFAYREVLLRARANDVARADLLAYALGSDLDHLAAFYDVMRLWGETDDALRARTILAIQGRSTGGTSARYRFVALSSSVEVRDAVVWHDGLSPIVYCAIFSTAVDGYASDALLATVTAALNDPAVRMVNDTIVVRRAVQTVQNIVASLTLLPDTSAEIILEVEALMRADWTTEGGLGRDLTRSWITAKLMRGGIQNCAITAPAQDVVVDPHQSISIGTVTLTVAGRGY